MEYSELFCHLSPKELVSYSITSKDSYETVQTVKMNHMFWKRRFEWYIGLWAEFYSYIGLKMGAAVSGENGAP